MPSVKLGRKALLQVRAGGVTGGVGTWLTVGSAADVTLSLPKEAADATARDSEGWKQEVAVLKSAAIQVDQVWRDTDQAREVIRAAWDSDGRVGVRCLDAVNGEGLEANCQVMDLSQSQPIAGVIRANIELKPTIDSAARWVEAFGRAAVQPSGAASDPGGGDFPWTDPGDAVGVDGDFASAETDADEETDLLQFTIGPMDVGSSTRAFLRVLARVETGGTGASIEFGWAGGLVDPIVLTDQWAWYEREINLAPGWQDLVDAGTVFTINGQAAGASANTFEIDHAEISLA